MKICDITQFYAPRSGGVKRYLHEKKDYIAARRPEAEHVLVVPGEKNGLSRSGRTRVYTITSPLVSRSTRYRALLNLRAIDDICEGERPDVIESADPYQLGWKAAAIAQRLQIPAVAFYHSDFAEAYLRAPAERFGASAPVMNAARAYTAALYNRFDVTLAPSPQLCAKLRATGIGRVELLELGVNTEVFTGNIDDASATRAAYDIPPNRTLLLYVGRLAPEKNTATLLDAFSLLRQRRPGAFHLLVVGDGQQRHLVENRANEPHDVKWIPYCAGGPELAQLYRAADLFVHPGTQETFGLVALESQACGTPVLGIRGSAMDRIILHDQAHWADEDSAAALADAVERATRDDLHAAGSVAARRVAEQYAWPHIFDRLFCVYHRLCSEYKQRQRHD